MKPPLVASPFLNNIVNFWKGLWRPVACRSMGNHRPWLFALGAAALGAKKRPKTMRDGLPLWSPSCPGWNSPEISWLYTRCLSGPSRLSFKSGWSVWMNHGFRFQNVTVNLDFRRAKVNSMLVFARTFQWSTIGALFFRACSLIGVTGAAENQCTAMDLLGSSGWTLFAPYLELLQPLLFILPGSYYIYYLIHTI